MYTCIHTPRYTPSYMYTPKCTHIYTPKCTSTYTHLNVHRIGKGEGGRERESLSVWERERAHMFVYICVVYIQTMATSMFEF